MKLPSQDPAFIARILAQADMAACQYAEADKSDEDAAADISFDCGMNDTLGDWLLENIQ